MYNSFAFYIVLSSEFQYYIYTHTRVSPF